MPPQRGSPWHLPEGGGGLCENSAAQKESPGHLPQGRAVYVRMLPPQRGPSKAGEVGDPFWPPGGPFWPTGGPFWPVRGGDSKRRPLLAGGGVELSVLP